jgi:hypothetical protein
MPNDPHDPYQPQLDALFAHWDERLHPAWLNWEGRPTDPELLTELLGTMREGVDKLERLQRTMRLQEEAREDGEW